MTGFEAQEYEALKRSVEEVGLKLEVRGDRFFLFKEERQLGGFGNSEQVRFYIYGYVVGYSFGKNYVLND